MNLNSYGIFLDSKHFKKYSGLYIYAFELRNIYLHFTIWATLEGGVRTWVPGEACFHLNGIVTKQILVWTTEHPHHLRERK